MSGAEIVPQTPFAIDPARGVLYDRTDGTQVALAECDEQTLAAIDEQVRAMRDFFRDATNVVEEELKLRMKGTRTLDTGSHLVELKAKREWDKTATWEALQGLQDAGLISEAEADAACPEKTERKPSGTKLNALLTRLVGEDPEAAAPLARARSEYTYVKVVRTSVDAEAVEV